MYAEERYILNYLEKTFKFDIFKRCFNDLNGRVYYNIKDEITLIFGFDRDFVEHFVNDWIESFGVSPIYFGVKQLLIKN